MASSSKTKFLPRGFTTLARVHNWRVFRFTRPFYSDCPVRLIDAAVRTHSRATIAAQATTPPNPIACAVQFPVLIDLLQCFPGHRADQFKTFNLHIVTHSTSFRWWKHWRKGICKCDLKKLVMRA